MAESIWSELRWLASVLVLAAAGTGSQTRAEDAQAATTSKDSMRELAALVPQGTPIRKVHFPSFDGNGKLQAIVDAEVMTKLDANLFSLQELSVRLFDAEGRPDMRFLNPHAFYDLSRGMLFSLARTKILRGSESTPVLEGTGFVFDLERRVGRLLKDTVARVQVGEEKISDANGPETAPAKTAAPTPSPTASPDESK